MARTLYVSMCTYASTPPRTVECFLLRSSAVPRSHFHAMVQTQVLNPRPAPHTIYTAHHRIASHEYSIPVVTSRLPINGVFWIIGIIRSTEQSPSARLKHSTTIVPSTISSPLSSCSSSYQYRIDLDKNYCDHYQEVMNEQGRWNTENNRLMSLYYFQLLSVNCIKMVYRSHYLTHSSYIFFRSAWLCDCA